MSSLLTADLWRRFVVLVLSCALSGVVLAQQPPQTPRGAKPVQKQAAKVKPKPSPVVQAEPTPPPAPPPPPTPEQMPPQPPRVTYQNGLLSIVAENSTLGDVLNAVRARTGATIDSPGGLNERVAAHLGPAPPRQVLADLLQGSHYDYVMMASPADPNSVQRILLTRNARAPATAASAAPPPAPINNPIQPTPQPPQEEEGMIPDSEIDVPEEAPPQPPETVAPPHRHGQGQMIPQPGANQPAVQPGQPNPPQIKTPEELLQELQRMQQQQQQQQNAPPPK